ncbi:unnamed protein product [Pseudo-nitzschia multistriata]|uniref:Inward rectifier potassium channel C-terminal domain-containing protein n=1 Tax=Pseudo-nitzschia multistriata TaxID=183589 RepID=A0A448Z1N2_9STRA|nr:unnamed protein product [Pseudo-nitzschia multistriata]
MIWSMMFNAFLFAFFYSLLSKSEFRSSQIIFTNKLLINIVEGDKMEGNRAYVRLQCYDIDSAHPLVEAHARMYVLDHKLKMHPLRLMDPNDDLGGVLYPSVPADIVHHIDCHSPLSPQRLPFVERSNGLVLRTLDSSTGNRDQIICPVCGEAYGTYERLKKHVEYNAMIEAKEGDYPTERSHVGFQFPVIKPLTLDDVRSHIEETLSEIIVVVEAIDPQLSGTFQSLQSYKYEDIVFGSEFAKCMSVNKERTEFLVDMQQFHKTYKNNPSIKHNIFDSIKRTKSDKTDPSTEHRVFDSMKRLKSDKSIENRRFLLSHISEDTFEDDVSEYHEQDIDLDDDEVSLENGGTYFSRSYNTFSSLHNPSGNLASIFTGRFHSSQSTRRSSTSSILSTNSSITVSEEEINTSMSQKRPTYDRLPSYSSHV